MFKQLNNCLIEEVLMKKTYKIEVDCANCANKVAEVIKVSRQIESDFGIEP